MKIYLTIRWKKIKNTLVIITIIAMVLAGYKNFFMSNKYTPVSGDDEIGVPVPILMYHSVLKDTKSSGKYVVTPDLFRKDMLYLQENNYTTIFVSDLVDYVYHDTPLPEKPIIITFDDGYLNNLTYILPILEELDIKAVISVVGSYTENFSKNIDPNPAYAHLTWDDISTLSQSNLVEIGNHSYDMHNLSSRKGASKKKGESSTEYKRILKEDLGKLQQLLTDNSNITPTVFAYPFGAYSEDSIDVLKELGIQAGLTCSEKVNCITKDPECLYHLGRFNRASGTSSEDFMKKLS